MVGIRHCFVVLFVPVRGTPWQSLIDFCCFRHPLKGTCLTIRAWPKTAEIDQGVEGQRVDNDGYTSTRPTCHCRTVSPQIEGGLKPASGREANLPAYSQPPPKAALCSCVLQIALVSDTLLPQIKQSQSPRLSMPRMFTDIFSATSANLQTVAGISTNAKSNDFSAFVNTAVHLSSLLKNVINIFALS